MLSIFRTMAAVCLAVALAQPAAGASPSALSLNGEEVRPLETKGQNAVVLLFLAVECPISNSYSPVLRRLSEEFRDVEFFAVYADANEQAPAIQKHLKEYNLKLAALRDTRHELARFTGATVTPEAAVIAAEGRLVYRGRIDDRYVSFGKKRPVATQHDLRDVLSELAQGKVPKLRTTPATGCSIPPLQP